MAGVSDFIQSVFENTTIGSTHVVYTEAKGEYRLRARAHAKFWRTYLSLARDPKHEGRLFFGERVGKTMPLTLEVRLPLDRPLVWTATDSFEDHPLEPFLNELVLVVQTQLFETLDSMDDQGRYAVVLQPRREVAVNNRHVWSFRIHFPYCHVETAWARADLLPALLAACRSAVDAEERPLLDCMPDGFHCRADWREVLDLPTESVPLVGSRRTVWDADYVFGTIYNNMSNGEAADFQLTLQDAFPLVNHVHLRSGLLNLHDLGEIDNARALVLVVSQAYCPTSTYAPRTSSASSAATSPAPAALNAWDTRLAASYSLTDEQSIAETLLPYVGRRRFQSEGDWLEIGRALRNTYHGHERGLSLWQKYTEQCADGAYTYEDCRRKYYAMHDPTFITHRTIGHYARVDDPAGYERWHAAWYGEKEQSLLACIKPTHGDVAGLLYRMFWLDLAFYNHVWYEYSHKDFGWTSYRKSNLPAARIISTRLLPHLKTLRANMSQYAAANQGVDHEKQIALINKTIIELNNHGFRSSVIGVSETDFAAPDIENRFDQNTRLFRTTNAVIELLSKGAVVRDGKPEDYLTRRGGVDYRHDFTMDSPAVRKYLYWLKEIFDADALIDYFLRLSASFLHGGNINKFLIVWSGAQGNNGKSTLNECIKRAFGTYHIEMPTSIITKQRGQSGSATPELVRSETARIASVKETDGEETIQVGKMKELTGNDAFYGRQLYGEGKDIKPQVKYIFQCNDVPQMNTQGDNAMANRLINIPFASVWTDKAPVAYEEQRKLRRYKKDKLFWEQLYEYAEAFLWLAVRYYARYIAEDVDNFPDEIIKSTERYWEINNYFKNFKAERLVRDPTAEAAVADVYAEFLRFLQDDFQKKTGLPTKSKFIEEMKKEGIDTKKSRFVGWRLATEDLA